MSDEAVHHDAMAQKLGEDAYESLIERSDESGECCCTTCVVREILDAAYDHLREAARTDVPAIDLAKVDPIHIPRLLGGK